MRNRSRNAFSVLVILILALSARAGEIHNAVRAGDLAAVKSLLERDPSLVNEKTPGGRTPLFDAVMSRNLQIAEYLIAKGADLRASDSFHSTPLHIACSGGAPLEMIRLLVENGADINADAKYSGKPLDLAFEGNAPPVVEYLKSRGADFSKFDLEVVPLAPNLRRITFPHGMRNNLCVSAGKDGVLVVDTGYSKRAVEELKQSIHGFNGGSVRYVINTHPHGDHIGGNSILPADIRAIDYQRLRCRVFQGLISKDDTPFGNNSGQSLPVPYSMRFNDEVIKLIPYPALHSESDILIYFSGSGVVHMGDLLLSQCFPAVRDIPGYMSFLAKVIEAFPSGTRFVSGHGRDLTRDELINYRNMLNTTIEIMKKNKSTGKSTEEMIRERILQSYESDYSLLDWLGPAYWIERVARSL